MDFIADFKDVQLTICFELRFVAFGLCEGTGVCSPLPVSLEERRQRITTALQTVNRDMLQRVWEELVY